MYDELITKLREIEAMCETASFEEAANVLKEAADAIEKLSKELIELKLLTCCCTEPPKDAHNCFETIDTPIRDYMVNPKEETRK